MSSTKRPHEHLNRAATQPEEDSYSNFQRDIYRSFHAPKWSTKPSEWEAEARRKVPAANFAYVWGAASSGRTHEFNTAAFDRYRLRPRMLVDCTVRDMRVTLFGKTLPSPILVAPVGVQTIMHPDGELATARACRDLQVPMVLSNASSSGIEQVAAASGEAAERWFQLYWPRPQWEEVTASLLGRARREGYRVLVVTLDTFTLAWRPNDLDASYLPFLQGIGTGIGMTDPVFNARYEAEAAADARPAREKLAELWAAVRATGSVPGAARLLWNLQTTMKSKAWLDVMNSGHYRRWEDLQTLKSLWDGPIVLKGIQTVEDAHLAIDHGADGIIVSNHGGRQLNGAVASLDALAAIGADDRVRSSGLTVLFDSGVRTGSDVLKALALGAKAVLIGRPMMYGLAMGGEEGVKHVLRCILADTDNQLGNVGRAALSDLSRDDLEIWAKANL